MSDVDREDYNDSNRAFLQAFLAHNILTFEEAKPILAAIFSVQEGREIDSTDVTADDFDSYVSTANNALSPLDLEIRSTFHQKHREQYYALVNTTSDAMTQLATTYSADEITFVKALLDAMFDGPANRGRKEAMCLTAMEAIQVARNSRRETQNGNSQTQHNLTARDAERLIERLRDEGWLEKSTREYYSLSPRALMELKGWLVDTYNDEDEDAAGNKIKFCHACKEIVTMGQRCARRECPCRLHDRCSTNFFRMQRSDRCPLCRTSWDDHGYVGENAIVMSQNNRNHANTSAARTRLEGEAQDEDEQD